MWDVGSAPKAHTKYIIIEKLIFAQVVKKFPALLEHNRDGPLRDMSRRNAHFSNSYFNSIFSNFDVFYMFRTSWVYLQEDRVYKQCLYDLFICIGVNSLEGGRVCPFPPARLLT
jgi:hypothetical protein